jgi:hypothetical protein
VPRRQLASIRLRLPGEKAFNRRAVGAALAATGPHALERRRGVGENNGLGLALPLRQRQRKGTVPDIACAERVDGAHRIGRYTGNTARGGIPEVLLQAGQVALLGEMRRHEARRPGQRETESWVLAKPGVVWRAYANELPNSVSRGEHPKTPR